MDITQQQEEEKRFTSAADLIAAQPNDLTPTPVDQIRRRHTQPRYQSAAELVQDEPGELDWTDPWKKLWANKSDVIPFVGAAREAFNLNKLNKAATRIAEGHGSGADEDMMFEFMVEAQRKRTWGHTVSSILTALPAFAGEFALTRGVYGAVSAAGRKATQKLVAKALTQKIAQGAFGKAVGATVGAAAGAAVQAAVVPARFVAEMMRQRLPEMELSADQASIVFEDQGKGWVDAMKTAAPRVWAEHFSERTGAALGLIPGSQKLHELQAKFFTKLLGPESGAAKAALDKIASKAGWHGWIEEFGEERVNSALLAALTDDPWSEVIPSFEQGTAELFAFGVPGAARAGIARGGRALRGKPEDPMPGETQGAKMPEDPDAPWKPPVPEGNDVGTDGAQVGQEEGIPKGPVERASTAAPTVAAQQAISAHFAQTGKKGRIVKPKTAIDLWAVEFERARGRNLVLIESDDGSPLSLSASSGGGVTVLDANALSPMKALIFHEAVHGIPDEDRRKLVARVRDEFPAVWKAARDSYMERYEELLGHRLDPSLADEEGVARLAEDLYPLLEALFEHPDVLQQLRDADPTFINRVIDAIRTALNYIPKVNLPLSKARQLEALRATVKELPASKDLSTEQFFQLGVMLKEAMELAQPAEDLVQPAPPTAADEETAMHTMATQEEEQPQGGKVEVAPDSPSEGERPDPSPTQTSPEAVEKTQPSKGDQPGKRSAPGKSRKKPGESAPQKAAEKPKVAKKPKVGKSISPLERAEKSASKAREAFEEAKNAKSPVTEDVVEARRALERANERLTKATRTATTKSTPGGLNTALRNREKLIGAQLERIRSLGKETKQDSKTIEGALRDHRKMLTKLSRRQDADNPRWLERHADDLMGELAGEWLGTAPQGTSVFEGLRKGIYKYQAPDSGVKVREQFTAKVFTGTGRTSKESIYAEGADGPTFPGAKYWALSEQEAIAYGPNVTSRELTLDVGQGEVVSSDGELAAMAGGTLIPSINVNRRAFLDRIQDTLVARGLDFLYVEILPDTDLNASGKSHKRLREIFGHSQVIELHAESDSAGQAATSLGLADEVMDAIEQSIGKVEAQENIPAPATAETILDDGRTSAEEQLEAQADADGFNVETGEFEGRKPGDAKPGWAEDLNRLFAVSRAGEIKPEVMAQARPLFAQAAEATLSDPTDPVDLVQRVVAYMHTHFEMNSERLRRMASYLQAYALEEKSNADKPRTSPSGTGEGPAAGVGEGPDADARPDGSRKRSGKRSPRVGDPGGQGVKGAGLQDSGDSEDARPAPGPGVGDSVSRGTGPATDNYDITGADELGGKGPKGKVQANIKAIRLLKKLEKEGRAATVAEQSILVQYVGWGNTAFANQIFGDGTSAAWQPFKDELKKLLTVKEWKAASASITNAHYTSAPVINFVWDAVKRMGFQGGRVLDPGSGLSHFLGLAPPGVDYTGVELDSLSARLAGKLYPRGNIENKDFAKFKRPDGYFDLVVGNPPFADVTILSDKRYKADRLSLHNFIFAKSADLVRPGGMMAMVTFRFFMDSQGEAARRLLQEKGMEMVHTVRLPNTAFKQNAGTEVITDIVILRKRLPSETAGAADWLPVIPRVVAGETPYVNRTFSKQVGKGTIIGTESMKGSMYGKNEYTVDWEHGQEAYETQLTSTLDLLPRDVIQAPEGPQSPAEREPSLADTLSPEHVKEEAFYLDGKTLMRKLDGVGVPVLPKKKGVEGGYAKTHIAAIKALLPIRDAVRTVLAIQVAGENADEARRKLNMVYKRYVKVHGPITKPKHTSYINKKTGKEVFRVREPNLDPFWEDPDYGRVGALERWDNDTQTASKTDIFDKDLTAPPKPQSINTAQDALAVSLNTLGRLDIADVARLAHKTEAEVVTELGVGIYQDPAAGWQTEDLYLSGNVRAKLLAAQDAAKGDPSFERNVEALQLVQPADLGPGDITATIGAPWVSARDFERFAQNVLKIRSIKVSFVAALGLWTVRSGSYDKITLSATTEFGTDYFPAPVLFGLIINGKPIKAYDTVDKKRILNVGASEAGVVKAAELQSLLQDWIWEDGERADRLLLHYNDTFNNTVPRKFNGDHLTFPGLVSELGGSPMTPHEHQRRVVWRIIQEGSTYMAHAVGAGKTMAMVMAGMEMKRLGIVRKPIYVVPNHMLRQFSSELLELYPTANILVADKKQFHKLRRRRFVGRMATGNWDAIIITTKAFEFIPVSEKAQADFMAEEVAALEAAMQDVDADDRISRKQLEKKIKTLTEKIEASTGTPKDNVATFEETGVDFMFVDEAQDFRKLPIATSKGSVKGVTTAGSNRSRDMNMKIQMLNRASSRGSVVLASGTPVTNTLGELYTIQRYMQPGTLAAHGLSAFDSWATMFGQVVADPEMQADGKFKIVSRFKRFQNLPELMRMVLERMDVVMSKDLHYLKRPKIRGGSRELVIANGSDLLEEYKNTFSTRLDDIQKRNGPPEKGQDNVLVVGGDAAYASLDVRLMDPANPNEEGSKLNLVVDNLFRIYTDGTAKKTTQMVFLDKPTPASRGDVGRSSASPRIRGFQPYDYIKEQLIARGVPADEIAFMQDYKKDEQKLQLFRDMNAGRKRVLIGSTATMGTGVNAQKRLVALHHASIPWLPSDIEQREGRIIRQGNSNEEVRLFAYATESTYDATLWNILENKQRFIDALFSGDLTLRTMDDLDGGASGFAEMKAITSGDPLLMEKASLENDIAKLTAAKRSHQNSAVGQLRRVKLAEELVGGLATQVEQAKAAEADTLPTQGDAFLMILSGQEHTNRKKAGQALQRLIRANVENVDDRGATRVVGSVAGLNIILSIGFNSQMLQGGRTIKLGLGHGESAWFPSGEKAWESDEDALGRIRSLESIASGTIGTRRGTLEAQLAERQQFITDAKGQKDKGYPRDEELKAMQARSKEIDEFMLERDKPKADPPQLGEADRVPPRKAAVAREVMEPGPRMSTWMETAGLSAKERKLVPDEEQLPAATDPGVNLLIDTWQEDEDGAIERYNADARQKEERLLKMVYGEEKGLSGAINKSKRAIAEERAGLKSRQKYRDLALAMHLFIDLEETGAERQAEVEQYWGKLTDYQRARIEQAYSLTSEQQAFVDEIIHENRVQGAMGIKAGVLSGKLSKDEKGNIRRTAREFYSARLWEKGEGDFPTDAAPRFTLATARSRRRKYTSILQGWALGRELQVESVIEAQAVSRRQIAKVIHARNLMKVASKSDLTSTSYNSETHPVQLKGGAFMEWTHSGNVGELVEGQVYGKDVHVDEDGNLFRRIPVYASKKLGNDLNHILAPSAIAGNKVVDFISKWNAILKATILAVSLFHHQAFMRSFVLASPGTWFKHLNLAKAYHKGKEALDEFGPELTDLVRGGLTIGRIQDLDEAKLREKTRIGELVDKVPGLGTAKRSLLRLRDHQLNFLFHKMGANLKVMTALLEYRHQIEKHSAKLADGTVTREDIARRVATFTNRDFGGLNLKRRDNLGGRRGDTAQHVMRLFLLAPDWTESNVASAIAAFGRGDEAQMYRAMWGRVLLRAGLATIVFNMLMAAMDEDDFLERWQNAGKAGRLRWLEVDITPIYRAFGGDRGKRSYFSILGHFRDPLKWVLNDKPGERGLVLPTRALKHKSSVFASMLMDAATGSNWADHPFTTWQELMGINDKGVYKTSRRNPDGTWRYRAGDPKGGKSAGQTTAFQFGGPSHSLSAGQVPSFAINRVRTWLPIPLENLLAFLMGEMDGFEATTKSVGLMVSQERIRE